MIVVEVSARRFVAATLYKQLKIKRQEKKWMILKVFQNGFMLGVEHVK